MNLRPILYAEDEENDAFFLKRAFKNAGINNPVVVAPDGKEAIDYCEGTGAYTDRVKNPLPALILLDLNLPLRSGIDVLSQIRHSPGFEKIPIIIFSSALQPSESELAYGKGANAYLIKPACPEELAGLSRGIRRFWLDRLED